VIITRIVGGLGNQMFQYAVGRAVSVQSGNPLKLDLTELKRDPRRPFQLNQFKTIIEEASPRDIPLLPRKSLYGQLFVRLKNIGRVPHVRETSSSFDPKILQLRASAYLSGYWQSEKYFAAHADIIRQDFSLREAIASERQRTLSKIREVGAAVSVHVRRGDYVTNASANAVHGTCEPGWYGVAMQKMAERVARPTFFIFSDDIQWARDNLPKNECMVFVEPQADGRDGEDMHLMASCHSHIIANSTFSWWGAWLNPRRDKQVLAPARWFRSAAHDDRDLISPSWKRI